VQDHVLKQNLVKEKFNWEVPVEVVPVPSSGTVYPSGTPLCNRETLEIKAMTAQEEDILSSPALIKQGTVITQLIRSCLVDKSINPDDMLLGDRNAIMISVRITGYGSEYTADATCPTCTQQSSQKFMLTDLAIQRLDIKPVAEGQNLFEYKLPVTGKTIHFKFMTGFDEANRSTKLEREKKLTGGMGIQKTVTSRLENYIVSVDGITDRNAIAQFISKMPARDSRSLRTYIIDNEPGVNMNVVMDCPHCSEMGRVALPMGASFFWPDQ
jgi:hypothetical protein